MTREDAVWSDGWDTKEKVSPNAELSNPPAESLKDFHTHNRQKIEAGVARLKELGGGAKKIIKEGAYETGAFVMTLPEMARRAGTRMKEIGGDINEARKVFQSAFSKESRAAVFAQARGELDKARAGLQAFAAEHYAYSKKNKERRRQASNEHRRLMLEGYLASLAQEEEQAKQEIAGKRLAVLHELANQAVTTGRKTEIQRSLDEVFGNAA